MRKMKAVMLKLALLVLVTLNASFILIPPESKDNYVIKAKEGEYIVTAKARYLLVPIELKNNTKDTLRHIELTCPKYFFYKVKSQALNSPQFEDCNNVEPRVLKIPPNQSNKVVIKFKFKDDFSGTRIEYRIGFDLYDHPKKYIENWHNLGVTARTTLTPTKTLWSNVVRMNIPSRKF